MTAPASSDIVITAPATGAAIWRAAAGDPAAAVAAARAAFPAWAAQSLAMRIEALRRFANVARRDAAAWAACLAQETGCPLWEALAEVDATVARVEIAARAHAERAAQRRHHNGLAGSVAIRHRPHGVLAAILPHAQPLLTAANQVFPALIAGNAVIVKPSEKACATVALMLAALHEAGVPAGAVIALIGGPGHGQALARDDAVDGVLFAGSAAVGIPLARALARRPERMLAIEIGGNNPLVVWDTPLIDDAAMLVVQSAFAGGGQRATAARRLIVRDTMAEAILPALKALADRMVIGAPFDEPAPFMGPVIDMAAADGLTQSLIWLMSHGGKPIKHMQRPREGLPFVTPAIIDVTAMADRPDVELFGPLLQVVRVATWDEALAAANATAFGRVAGLIGGGPADYDRFWAGVRAGTVTWNRPTNADLPQAPCGGTGLSGNLRPGGAYAADRCTFPVASAEVEQPRAHEGAGFRTAA